MHKALINTLLRKTFSPPEGNVVMVAAGSIYEKQRNFYKLLLNKKVNCYKEIKLASLALTGKTIKVNEIRLGFKNFRFKTGLRK